MSDLSRLSLRLSALCDDDALVVLGFREDDRADVRRAIVAALADVDRLSEIALLAQRIRSRIGDFVTADDSLDHPAARNDWRGTGVLPLLALLAVSDDVRAFHRSRGVSAEISDRSLSDLGQQAWVHRRTFGAFGLHTYRWLTTAFSGNLYWLGRLQFNLIERDGGWAISTHIPESGPLAPVSVDDAFTQAVAFFAEHFPDHPTRLLHCSSWLLDPQLAEAVDSGSNMVRFQKRWTLEGGPTLADADAIFFVFRRRGDPDRSTLPRETSLQRAILDRIDAGGHWNSWNGIIEHDPFL